MIQGKKGNSNNDNNVDKLGNSESQNFITNEGKIQ